MKLMRISITDITDRVRTTFRTAREKTSSLITTVKEKAAALGARARAFVDRVFDLPEYVEGPLVVGTDFVLRFMAATWLCSFFVTTPFALVGGVLVALACLPHLMANYVGSRVLREVGEIHAALGLS